MEFPPWLSFIVSELPLVVCSVTNLLVIGNPYVSFTVTVTVQAAVLPAGS